MADVGTVAVDPLAHRAVERLSRWWPGLDSGR
jgi:hypothetical protein